MTPTHLIPVHPDRELHWLNENEEEDYKEEIIKEVLDESVPNI